MNNHDAKLQHLLTSIPGNLECADCHKPGKHNIRFCSVKLGVFLCNQCYAAHRALGAHITRVKCIGLDTFSAQEVELLETCGGNRQVNAQYEATMPATGIKPPPTKCNGCSLRSCPDCSQRLAFIRNKYETKLWYQEVPVAATTSIPSTLQPPPQQQQGNDQFGLFGASDNTRSQKSFCNNKKPSDTDFFASFGV